MKISKENQQIIFLLVPIYEETQKSSWPDQGENDWCFILVAYQLFIDYLIPKFNSFEMFDCNHN